MHEQLYFIGGTVPSDRPVSAMQYLALLAVLPSASDRLEPQ